MKKTLLVIGAGAALVALLATCCTGSGQQNEAAKTPTAVKSSAKTPVKTANASYAVTGMTCSGCVAQVQAALSKVDGVVGSDVSLEEGLAEVQYDPQKADPDKIQKALQTTGFGIKPLKKE